MFWVTLLEKYLKQTQLSLKNCISSLNVFFDVLYHRVGALAVTYFDWDDTFTPVFSEVDTRYQAVMTRCISQKNESESTKSIWHNGGNEREEDNLLETSPLPQKTNGFSIISHSQIIITLFLSCWLFCLPETALCPATPVGCAYMYSTQTHTDPGSYYLFCTVQNNLLNFYLYIFKLWLSQAAVFPGVTNVIIMTHLCIFFSS